MDVDEAAVARLAAVARVPADRARFFLEAAAGDEGVALGLATGERRGVGVSRGLTRADAAGADPSRSPQTLAAASARGPERAALPRPPRRGADRGRPGHAPGVAPWAPYCGCRSTPSASPRAPRAPRSPSPSPRAARSCRAL